MYDVIVIGAGVVGLATSYALAKQGKRTLLIEQFPLPHTRGSSHGASRITRQAYAEPFLANIMTVATPMWTVLEQESGMELFRKAGLLCVAPTGNEELLAHHRVTQSHSKEEVPLSNAEDIMATYPQISLQSTDEGFVDSSAGTLYADRCLQAFQKVFLNKGGVIKDKCKVVDIFPGQTVTVRTSEGDLRSKGVVLTCGPWAGEMLAKVGVSLPLETQVMQVCYWKSKAGHDHTKLPTFIALFEDGSSIYGLPTSEYPDMMKICNHHGEPCDPDMRDQVDDKREAQEMAHLKEYVARTFPGLIPQPAIKERCIYTITPDDICVVDSHPIYKNIAYGAGFSGSGFKTAPVVGALLADLVQGKQPSNLLVDELRAKRFSEKSKL